MLQIKKLSESYFEEAKWLNKKYKPSFKEYMELALNTTGYTLLISISFLGLGDHIVTNEVLQWLSNGPQIIKASTIICRLMDDIASHKVCVYIFSGHSLHFHLGFKMKFYMYLI